VPPAVAVVVVHWNQPERCAATLEHLAHQGVSVWAIVVDNGSTSAALASLRAAVTAATRPGVTAELIELGRNTGFGPAANTGLRRWLRDGDGTWAAVMPHDALAHEDTLSRLIEAAEARPRAGLACADVGDGQTPVIDPYFGGMTVPARTDEGWEPVGYPHGTLLLARRECLEQIGVFDERFFAYCEEADLAIRATAAGWEIGLVRGVRVTNSAMKGGNPAVDYLRLRNTLHLVREHSGRYHAFIRLCIAGLQLVRAEVQPSSRPLFFSARGRLWAMADFLRGRFGPPPPRLLAAAEFEQIDDVEQVVDR